MQATCHICSHCLNPKRNVTDISVCITQHQCSDSTNHHWQFWWFFSLCQLKSISIQPSVGAFFGGILKVIMWCFNASHQDHDMFQLFHDSVEYAYNQISCAKQCDFESHITPIVPWPQICQVRPWPQRFARQRVAYLINWGDTCFDTGSMLRNPVWSL